MIELISCCFKPVFVSILILVINNQHRLFSLSLLTLKMCRSPKSHHALCLTLQCSIIQSTRQPTPFRFILIWCYIFVIMKYMTNFIAVLEGSQGRHTTTANGDINCKTYLNFSSLESPPKKDQRSAGVLGLCAAASPATLAGSSWWLPSVYSQGMFVSWISKCSK